MASPKSSTRPNQENQEPQFQDFFPTMAGKLGGEDLTDDDVRCMINEGDCDRDGALNQMEFCVLMFRLSPELMEASRCVVTEVIEEEFSDYSNRH
ncbi:EF-hand domain [Arabidopsis thaliana x Arabidopsis arenosa]|uniref:EF-hand domain n=1 Tax=Arabidopsis thaliana x Arabidopsis arenosa TaxID=1240361 RepID=A0A8T1XK98_9BRAS|nr:EF-hand domain [Arabidopsis thaliana x Arabidopsis arenosa]